MKKLPLRDKIIITVSLIASILILRLMYSSGKHERMPDIGPELVPNSFSNAIDILVLPLWVVIPYFYTDTQERLYLISSSFIAPGLQYISSNLDRPEAWNIVTPGFRIGNKFRMLRGIYLILKSGDVVWLSAGLGHKTRWGYIKWTIMCKDWQNELEAAIENGKTLRRKEADYKFLGANYGDYMKIEVKLTPAEKKLIKDFLASINYENITNGGQWKLMFE